jgi:hypothetical protein
MAEGNNAQKPFSRQSDYALISFGAGSSRRFEAAAGEEK